MAEHDDRPDRGQVPPLDPDPKPPEPAHSIREEHDELRALLADIQESELTAAIPLLGQLRTLLIEHFETEEGPEGFEAITQKQPQFLPRLSEIFDEHRAFLERLESIAARAEACATERQRILDDVHGLAQDLHEHEARENELLGDVLYTDLGGHN